MNFDQIKSILTVFEQQRFHMGTLRHLILGFNLKNEGFISSELLILLDGANISSALFLRILLLICQVQDVQPIELVLNVSWILYFILKEFLFLPPLRMIICSM